MYGFDTKKHFKKSKNVTNSMTYQSALFDEDKLVPTSYHVRKLKK